MQYVYNKALTNRRTDLIKSIMAHITDGITAEYYLTASPNEENDDKSYSIGISLYSEGKFILRETASNVANGRERAEIILDTPAKYTVTPEALVDTLESVYDLIDSKSKCL